MANLSSLIKAKCVVSIFLFKLQNFIVSNELQDAKPEDGSDFKFETKTSFFWFFRPLTFWWIVAQNLHFISYIKTDYPHL